MTKKTLLLITLLCTSSLTTSLFAQEEGTPPKKRSPWSLQIDSSDIDLEEIIDWTSMIEGVPISSQETLWEGLSIIVRS